ncbi:hypothetical protein C5615_28425 [Burkholderia cepacia]|uniref:Lipoprotein n=1 Tax=Burkholderia cepacia TaxID=292 RepID=A0A2S8IGH4_BURCE|nr:hypothetical protein [Burkholderia cepacia]PQP13870.1 hypothetical protein C5615_28425 [Burkholderia cepacia]HDR9510218.1 hypothetical protein [Burkholderia cepacia]HDR9512580.1 hypothetical protein [Burkholderia cepacia]
MKLLRTFILLLLCAVLPISGLAASGLTGECPMQHTMSMEADTGMSMTMSADMSDCDSMKSPSASSAKAKAKAKAMACKVTAQCQFGSLYHPAGRVDVTRPAAFASTIVFHYTQSVPVRDPSGLWRPPRIS